MLPNAIDHHACGQRVLGAGQPADQFPTQFGQAGFEFVPLSTRDRTVKGVRVGDRQNQQVAGSANPLARHPTEKGIRALENARQCVVVGLGNRVELVIMATGTGDRDPQDGPRGRVDLFVDQIGPKLARILFGDSLRPDRPKTRGDQILGPLLVRRGGQQVTRDLFSDEAIVGLVGVERIDDVVPVPPRTPWPSSEWQR